MIFICVVYFFITTTIIFDFLLAFSISLVNLFCSRQESRGRFRRSRRLTRSAEPIAVGHRRQTKTCKVNFVLAAHAQEHDGSIRVQGLSNSLVAVVVIVVIVVVVVVAAVVHQIVGSRDVSGGLRKPDFTLSSHAHVTF